MVLSYVELVNPLPCMLAECVCHRLSSLPAVCYSAPPYVYYGTNSFILVPECFFSTFFVWVSCGELRRQRAPSVSLYFALYWSRGSLAVMGRCILSAGTIAHRLLSYFRCCRVVRAGSAVGSCRTVSGPTWGLKPRGAVSDLSRGTERLAAMHMCW